MTTNALYRTCPSTGLQYHKTAELLIKAHLIAGLICLLIGGVLALLVTLTRWPAVHLLPAMEFYQALTAHGVDMLIFWIMFFEIAMFHLFSSTLLRSRIATPRIAWLGFVLMLIGAVMTNLAILKGDASVMMTSYVPMPANPNFYLGLIIYVVGALIGCFVFFGTLVVAKAERTYEGSIPLVTFGAVTAVIIAVFTIASAAIILGPTWLWSIGYISHIDPMMYRLIWWALGHSSQQINVALHVAIWYAIAAVVFGARPLSERVSRGAYLLYILFLQFASVHHLLVDPGVSSEFKIFNTSYAMYLAVLASMIHGLTVPGSIEVAQRRKGFNKGLFEWLRKAPWGNPVFSGMFISLVGFGFIGGITGVVMGTEQINIIIHNTIYVPGHFHATVVIGTTLAFMAFTYFLIPTLFKRELIWTGLARWQPYLFGLGMAFFTLVMMGAGTLGVSRRHWDMAFTGSALGYEYPGSAYLLMGLVGISGVVAIVGGALFLLISMGSILFGKKIEAPGYGTERTVALRASPIESHGSIGVAGFEAPGSLALALLLLTIFVVYYAINWKYLTSVWPLS